MDDIVLTVNSIAYLLLLNMQRKVREMIKRMHITMFNKGPLPTGRGLLHFFIHNTVPEKGLPLY